MARVKQLVVNLMSKAEDFVDMAMMPFEQMATSLGLPTPPKPVRPSQIVEQLPEPPSPSQVLASMGQVLPFQLPAQARAAQPRQVAQVQREQSGAVIVQPIGQPKHVMRELESQEEVIIV